jgi:hypothetical protein
MAAVSGSNMLSVMRLSRKPLHQRSASKMGFENIQKIIKSVTSLREV